VICTRFYLPTSVMARLPFTVFFNASRKYSSAVFRLMITCVISRAHQYNEKFTMRGKPKVHYCFFNKATNPRKVWEAARKEAGIASVRFYDLRHTFATRMADAGMEMQELAKILGHTDISMTYRYYHLTKKVNDRMRDILNKRRRRAGQT
jgi:integrase